MSRGNRSVKTAEQPKQESPGGPEVSPQRRETRARQDQARARSQPKRAESPAKATTPTSRVPRLLQRYRDEVLPTLMKEFGYTVPLQAPRLEKVVLNVGLGEALQNPNALEAAAQQLATISGQHPVITKARRSIAGFKLRAGMSIGAMVTLRGQRMYDFVDRVVNAALPRIRDFRGVSRDSFDGRGNYSLAIREQVVFPEIDYSRVDRIRGFQVTFVTSANSDGEALRLLELLGMPFTRDHSSRG